MFIYDFSSLKRGIFCEVRSLDFSLVKISQHIVVDVIINLIIVTFSAASYIYTFGVYIHVYHYITHAGHSAAPPSIHLL